MFCKFGALVHAPDLCIDKIHFVIQNREMSGHNADEIEARNAMITRAADAIELVMLSGVSRASSAINSDNELFPLPRESN